MGACGSILPMIALVQNEQANTLLLITRHLRQNNNNQQGFLSNLQEIYIHLSSSSVNKKIQNTFGGGLKCQVIGELI